MENITSEKIHYDDNGTLSENLDELLLKSTSNFIQITGKTGCKMYNKKVFSLAWTETPELLKFYNSTEQKHSVEIYIKEDFSINNAKILLESLYKVTEFIFKVWGVYFFDFTLNEKKAIIKIIYLNDGKNIEIPIEILIKNPIIVVALVKKLWEFYKNFKKETWVSLGGEEGFLAYKKLIIKNEEIYSPVMKTKWENNELKSDFIPALFPSAGIYSAKDIFFPGLNGYPGNLFEIFVPFKDTIISEFGYRSAYAKIIRKIPEEEFFQLTKLEEAIINDLLKEAI